MVPVFLGRWFFFRGTINRTLRRLIHAKERWLRGELNVPARNGRRVLLSREMGDVFNWDDNMRVLLSTPVPLGIGATDAGRKDKKKKSRSIATGEPAFLSYKGSRRGHYSAPI